MFPRSSGLLLHVTSLPGGRLGAEAHRFVDFCARAGQRWWQMLPVAPTGGGGSPYAALSAFAGDDRLLARVAPPPDEAGLAPFRRTQRGWLEDYALFRALRDEHEAAAWTRWPPALRDRTPGALAEAAARHADAIDRHVRAQYAFDAQWRALKRYANDRGVGLIGDLPLFVAHDSADVWAHRELFKLHRNGRPRVVTGVPPDYFSETGQLWGNPHYDWKTMRRRRFRWWIARLRRMFELFDAVRIDHYLGLLRAWEVSSRARTARRGRWEPGPKDAFFRAVFRAIPNALLIAEDLGLVTAEANALRARFGLPGMRVLHFSFGPDPWDRPFAFPKSCAVYTGTHDNNTTAGWFAEGGEDRRRALVYAGCPRRRIHWGLVRVAHLSAADLAIVPVQDLLGLGAHARMNTPGTVGGRNWKWRLKKGALDARLARRLRRLTEVAGR